MEQRILNGWKEISAFLQRGTRTAQRWELLFGMPVHRPANRRRTAVIAFSDELHLWLMRNRAALDRDLADSDGDASPSQLYEALNRLENESKEITAKLSHLRQRLKGRLDATAETHS